MALKKWDTLTAADTSEPKSSDYLIMKAQAPRRTRIGGILTITAIITIFFLAAIEVRSYFSIVSRNTLKVDNTLGQDTFIFFDISFPQLPCHMFTLDLVDLAGDVQQNVEDGITRKYIDKSGSILETIDTQHDTPKDYCGPCYGAGQPNECCNSCSKVLEAYTQRRWSITDIAQFEQCTRENYEQITQRHRNSGCRVNGSIKIKKVKGTFHFAPGFSRIDQGRGEHAHDMKKYFESDDTSGGIYTFSHKIHRLAFGDSEAAIRDSDQPLTDHTEHTDDRGTHFDYFLKCVSRTFIPFKRGQPKESSMSYSATKHLKHFAISNEDTPSHVNMYHTIPGLFVYFDISPLHIVDEEARQVSLGELFSSITAVIGGVITLFALLNHGLQVIVSRFQKDK